MHGGCPVGCCICAVRHGWQAVVRRMSSSSAAWAGKVFGGGRVQRRLLGTAKECKLARTQHTRHTQHAPSEKVLSLSFLCWVCRVCRVCWV